MRLVVYNIPSVSGLVTHLAPWRRLLACEGLSERLAAAKAGISRATWRALASGSDTVGLQSLEAAARLLGLNIAIVLIPRETQSDYSTVAVSYKVQRDGPPSWKIHFMDFVDEFRRSLDPGLLLLPPSRDLSLELRALLAGIVLTLADEVGMAAPLWARKRYELPRPWFVAATENLKAMALMESPLPFRRNNIFVTSNFLSRV
jgi:hypothetical protein